MEDRYFVASSGIKELKEFIFECVQRILDFKIIYPSKTWTQPAELNKIVDHWNNFDEGMKQLILVSIPEVAPHLLTMRIKDIRLYLQNH